jgi:hypothetical protein
MSDSTPLPRNWPRRALGIGICLSPIAIAVCSFVSGIRGPITISAGFYVVLTGSLIAGFNFYLSFLRPLQYRFTHGSYDGYRHVSGAPMVGSLVVLVGVLLWFGDVLSASVGLIGLLFDTGGPQWFLVATWRDASLWDARHPP